MTGKRTAKRRDDGAGPLPFICLVGAALLAATAAGSADWPQYRGPGRDGRSAETGLLTSWPEGGPELLWRVPLGDGYSGIAAAAGRLFTQFGDGGSEWLAAFDAASGRELWRFQMDRNRRDAYGNGPRATPVVDGELVYGHGARSTLYALDVASGERRWGYDLKQEFGAKVPNWGTSSSPLVEGRLLVVDVAGRSGYGIVAFDKQSGEVVWHAESHLPAYSSPIAVTVAGERQLVFFTAAGLVGVAAEDGRRLWNVPWRTSYDVNAAMPLFVPRSGFFVSSDYDVGAGLFQVVREEAGGVEVFQVWKSRVMRNHFNSSVLVGSEIYGFDNSRLKCIDAVTGELRWQASRGFSKGSLLYADGHLIVLSDNGRLGLVEATPEAYRVKASAQVLRSKTWTMPSLADGVLYIRDQREMLALRVGS